MKHALAFMLVIVIVAAALAGSAHAVDVYKWKDSKGVVHYGDRPASGVAATTLSVPDDALSPQDEADANARLEQARARLAAQVNADVPSPARVGPQRKTASDSCTNAWAQYDAAQACYVNHRAANGKGVSPSGLALCRPMPEPTCAR